MRFVFAYSSCLISEQNKRVNRSYTSLAVFTINDSLTIRRVAPFFRIGKSYCSAWLSIEVLNFDFLIPISIFPVLKKVQCCCTISLLEIMHTTHCSVFTTSEECAAVDADRQFGIGMFCCMRVPFSLFQRPNSHLRYSTAIASRRNPSSRWRRHHFMPTLGSTLRAQLLVEETALLRSCLPGAVNCRQM